MPSAAAVARDKAENLCGNISYVVNPESPYTVEKLGEIRQVLSGGEYEDIYSDSLCVQRAEYENWKSTRLQDGITLEMMGIPWLDVNQKLRYTASTAILKNVTELCTAESLHVWLSVVRQWKHF